MTANQTSPFCHPHVASKGPIAISFKPHSMDRTSCPFVPSVSLGCEMMRSGQSLGTETCVLLNVAAKSDKLLVNVMLRIYKMHSVRTFFSSAEGQTNVKSGLSPAATSFLNR